MRPERLPRTVLWLVVLAITLYCAADEQWSMFIIGVPLALLGWRLTHRPDSQGLPRWIIVLLALAVLANALYAFSRHVEVSDFCQTVIYIVILKFFTRRAARDYAQILVLTTFLGLGALLLSPQLLVGLVLAIFLPLLVVAVVQFQFYAAVEASRPPADAPTPLPVTEAPRGRRFGVHIAALIVVILCSGMTVSAGVFVIVPRGIGKDVIREGWMGYRADSISGFTDVVRLGEGGTISQSSVAVLDFALRDEQGDVRGGPSEIYYLRGAVLERYESGEWRKRDRQRSRHNRDSLVHQLRNSVTRNGPEIEQTVTFRVVPRGDAYLFTLWRPYAIETSIGVDLDLDNSTYTYAISNVPPRLRYTVKSELIGLGPQRVDPTDPVPVDEPDDESGPPGVRPSHNQLQRDAFRRENLAQFVGTPIHDAAIEVLRAAGIEPDPALRDPGLNGQAARAIENWLRTDFTYTLDLGRPPPDVDPIEWFIAPGNRRGHCEYFASAMAAMCRSVGIDARVVAGYVAAEWIPQTRTYTVRESNAHAWVEVEVHHDRGSTWRTYDPTPPGDLRQIHQTEPGFFARINRWIDSLEYLWITSIVGFDEDSRSRIFGARADAVDARPFDARAFANSPFSRFFRSIAGGLVVFVIVYVAGMLILRLAARRTDRRRAKEALEAWARGDPELTALLHQAGFYARLLDVLSAKGHAKPDWKPPLAHSRDIRAADRPLGDVASRLSGFYYALRFGRRPLSAFDQAALASELERLDKLPSPSA